MEQPAHFQNLPPEIWAEIFLHARKSSLIEGSYDQAKSMPCDVPISVSQVCDRFRQVSITTPRLWTSIVVNFSAPNPSSSYLPMTKLWLERSKSSPLSIFMFRIYGPDIVQQLEKRECFIAFLSQIGRWKEAALEWIDNDSGFCSLMGVTPYAPVLESLVLKPIVADGEVPKNGFLPSKIWANSPRPRKLLVTVLCEKIIRDDSNSPIPEEHKCAAWTMSYAIPYKQLTHLHLGAGIEEVLSCRDILTVFRCASNLVCCFIEGIGDIEPVVGHSPPPIVIKHLRHLCLAGDTSYHIPISRFLDCIAAPSLLSLFVSQGSTQKFHLDSFSNFVHQSSCPLEELNICGIWMDIQEIHACMELTSDSLRRIHFGSISSDTPANNFASRMTSWNSVTREYELCPYLEQISMFPWFLDFRFSSIPHPFSWIMQVLASRLRPPPGGLKRFKTLLIPSQFEKEILPELRMLCEDPMGLTIGFNRGYDIDTLWERFAYE